jgi:hypothetical protein
MEIKYINIGQKGIKSGRRKPERSRRATMKKSLILLLTVLLLASLTLVGCNGETSGPPADEAEPPPAEEEPLAEEEESPTPPGLGEWIAQTWFDQFTFTLTVLSDPRGTIGIAEVSLIWTDFRCGGVTMDGTVTVSSSPFLCSITNREFTCDETIPVYIGTSSANWDVSIVGEFSEDGTHAYGTWGIGSKGAACEVGIWEAWAP